MVSTPYPMGQQQMSGISYSPISRNLGERTQTQQPQPFAIQQPQDIKYSPKHTGLYLYLIRLLRPIWKKKCIVDGVSSLTHDNCSEILNELYALKAFLEDTPLNNYSGRIQSILSFELKSPILVCFTDISSASAINNEYGQASMMQQKNPLEQAIVDDEKRSINALSLFISKFFWI